MKNMNLSLDPRIMAVIDVLAAQKHTTRTAIIRDAIYTAVWNAKKGGPPLRTAPTCGPMIENTMLRVVDGKLAPIDSDGLLI
jgi:hypothetical protein